MILKQINIVTHKPLNSQSIEKINKLIEVNEVHINGNIVIKKVNKVVTFTEKILLKSELSKILEISMSKILFTYEEKINYLESI